MNKKNTIIALSAALVLLAGAAVFVFRKQIFKRSAEPAQAPADIAPEPQIIIERATPTAGPERKRPIR